MKFSAYKFLENVEAFRAEPYLDSAGYWTVGIGHKMTHSEVTSGKILIRGMSCRPPLTRDQAIALKDQDMEPVENVINGLGVELTQNQSDALCSLAFNIGIGAFLASTLVRKLRAGAEPAEIAKEMKRWNKARNPRTGILEVSKGLVNRRKADAELYLSA